MVVINSIALLGRIYNRINNLYPNQAVELLQFSSPLFCHYEEQSDEKSHQLYRKPNGILRYAQDDRPFTNHISLLEGIPLSIDSSLHSELQNHYIFRFIVN